MNFANLIYLILFETVSTALSHVALEEPSVCDSYSCGKGECFEIGGNPTCMCPPEGIYSSNCEDPCDVHSISCENNGTCIADEYSENQVKCKCDQPFYGDRCELGPCQPNPCESGEICEVINSTYKCKCEDEQCGSENDSCDTNPCGNGTCVPNKGNTYYCICPSDGFKYLDNCLIEICSPNPCKNDGTCEPLKGGDLPYKCTCKKGFHGKDCESEFKDPCIQNPCKNNGKCSSDGDKFHCTCIENFRGPTCEEQNKDPCSPNPCKNGGKCSSNGDQYVCTCMENFKGLKCEEFIQNPCDLKPCKNNGSCSTVGDKYYCACLEDFKGPTCKERAKDPCSLNPCKNGGICTSDGDAYFCACLEKFKGPKCEEIQDPCTSNPCNNVSCFRDLESFRCNCNETHTGKNCEKDLKSEPGDTLDTIIYASGGTGFLLLAVLGILIILRMRKKRRSATEINYIQNIDASSTGSGASDASLV